MIKLLYAALGTLGFGILFKAHKNKLLTIMVGGFVNYLVYFLTFKISNNIFLSSFLCAIATLVYANVFAILRKCPATIYILTGLIPVVPGSSLFYTMQGFVLKDYVMAKNNLNITIEVILGIVAGMALSTVVVIIIKEIFKIFKINNKNC